MLSRLFRYVRSRLSVKVNLTIVVSLMLLMVVPCLLLTKFYTEQMISEAEKDARRVAELFADLCANPLSRHAYGLLVNNTRSLLDNETVLSVKINDNNGHNVIPWMPKTPADDAVVYTVKSNIIGRHFNLGNIGIVEVAFDLTTVHRHSQRLFFLLNFSTVVTGVLIIALLSLLLHRFVTRPVHLLLDSIRNIAMGDLEHRLEFVRGDEIGNLARNINLMAENLSASMQARDAAEADLRKLNRELEEKVLERTRRLSEKAIELSEANVRLQELDDVKSTLLSQVSHELRTPLTSILGFNKLIVRDIHKIHERQRAGTGEVERRKQRILENLDIIDLEAQRLARLINDVLDLSKIEAGHMEWHDKHVPLTDLITRAVKVSEGAFSVKPNVTLYCTIPPQLPNITVDPDRFSQVLINLLNNAAKFTTEGSVSVTTTMVDESRVEVSVSDTGLGIRKEEQARIFEKFSQVPHETGCTLPKGTGLGLAICKEIVEHYGGTISVQSEYGQGSRFSVILPLEAA